MTDVQTKDRIYMAALAGLLHDVGKFGQRAGWESGRHTEVGGEFVRQYVPQLWRPYLYSVMGHHDPVAQMDYVTQSVALADRLSAGERADEGQAQPNRLLSIFCRLDIGGQTAPKQCYWPLKPLALHEDILFPVQDPGGTYGELWAGFARDAQRLADIHDADIDPAAYLESMLLLLQRYTWCIPSAYYRSLPDVSLYDHCRTTAALATCLSGLDEACLQDLLDHHSQAEPIVLLLGGDLSGVQSFLYTITARGAARGLRGRSFYLQLLTEAVARYTLRQLGLPITNLLYVGGGHFYLLAPAAAAARLSELQAEIGRKLLRHHQGDLYLALGSAPLTAVDFQRESFAQKWGEVGQAMNRAKRQRFADLDAETLREEVFAPLGEGGDAESECQVCHYYGPEVGPEGDDEEVRRICPLCASLETLGTQLRDAAFLVLGEVEQDDCRPRGTYVEALAAFGLTIGLTSTAGRPVHPVDGRPRRAVLLAMHDVDDALAAAAGLATKLRCPVAAGSRYTTNVTPRRADGEITTFDDLQAQSQGVKRLGVLRMDVDDLGDLFGRGLGSDATLSRVSALSSALGLFFEGWVGRLCHQTNQQADAAKTYAIYSGGDDLFIVGAWDVLPGLAHSIRRDLARFAAENPLLHISGGLTLHGTKYPLYQAAIEAEEALDAAKDLERKDGHRKDALNFLGLTIGWEEYETIVDIKDELVALVSQDDAPRALLQTLGALYARYLERYQKTRVQWGPWMWRGTYSLTRMAARAGSAKGRIEKIRDDLKQDDYRRIRLVGPAARWAELLTRKEQAK